MKYLPLALLAIILAGCEGEGVQLEPVEQTTESPQTEVSEGPAAVEPQLGAATGGKSEVGEWGQVLPWPHVAVSMAGLPDGRILTYSGSERRTWPTTEQTYSATWNPENGQFVENLHRGHNMFCAALSMTSDGQVLVNGGRNQGNSPWTTLFDYRDNNWNQIENMASGGRWYPTTLALGDGKVMTALGVSTNTRNPDLWDPEAGWRVLNGIDFINMRQRNNQRGRDNSFPLLSLAPTGNVYHYWDTTENQMVSPQGNGRSRPANPTTDGVNHAGGIQVMYDAGKLLISGRNDGSWGGNATGAASNAFTIDLNGPVPDIRATSDMAHRRKFHQMIPLPTGEVLVVGGNTTGVKFRDSGSVMEPEIWNPETGRWRGMANMAVPRDYHSTAMLLTDGRILTAGGGYDSGNPNSSGTHQDAQIFSPPYLFNANGSAAARPTVTVAQPSADTGQSILASTTGDVAYFSLIRMSATTHAMNTDARFYKPQFQSAGTNQYQVTLHENPNISTPGYWMLFAVNNAGVPSEAQVIRITALDTRLDNYALTGTASQSSTLDSMSAARAIDGDLSGDLASQSLAHTNNDAGSFWEIDLGRIVEIDTVRLWNRTDYCCVDQWSDFHVLVSSQPFVSTDLNTTLAQSGVLDFHTPGTAGRQTDVSVVAKGRYVRVQLTNPGQLQLAEVQVFGSPRTDLVNVAVDGSATQSSLYANEQQYGADRAIDDIVNQQSNRRFNHTNSDVNAWWELDIGRVVDIDSVKVWNRTDCCTTRLSDFHLFISDVPFTARNKDTTLVQPGVFSSFQPGAASPLTEIPVGRSGRYLRVQLNGTGILHMQELQVMASELPLPLELQPLTSSPMQRGNDLSLTASATGGGTLQYQWNFGDGSADTSFSTNPSITHRYSEPGRYVVSVTVRDSTGDEVRQTYTQIVHEALTASSPVASTSIIAHSNGGQIWNVNPDNNSVGVIDTAMLSLLAEIDVGINPVSLAEAPNGDVWVTNRESSSITVVSPASLAVVDVYPLDRAAQPYGIVFDQSNAYVALEAIGQVQKINTNGVTVDSRNVGDSPRHLSLDATAETLFVSRFITPKLPGEDTLNPIIDDGTRKYGGEVVVMDAASLGITDTIILEHGNNVASENQGPGIPNYLGPAVISPAGSIAWLPSKQDNILSGAARGGTGMSFDQTVRAITSKIDLVSGTEILGDRIDHDNASVASQSVFGPYGTTLFSSLEGNRQISIIDTGTAIEIGRFDTGRAPQGMVVSGDGRRLYVHNFMDRTVGVHDIEDIVVNGSTDSTEIATVNAVSNELLDATVLRGKQLFYDARDDRLAGLDYMSCASCHADGEHDGRIWDFTSLGEGLRNTITLKGRAGMGHGILHWTGNFDELQDFEGQIREFGGGTGLMEDFDFAATDAPLGNPKAGLSSDLDALASYMTSLARVEDSPLKNNDGSQTDDALAGESVFVSKGCGSCHGGIEFTDSLNALRHDVGSIMPDSGLRLGAALDGLDTPTLLGVWSTAPYLHDGSADTLQDAISAHLNIDTTALEQDQLAAYLGQLDNGNSLPPVLPPDPPTEPGGTVSNLLPNNTLVVDGNLTEWNALQSFGSDGDDSNESIDWKEAWLAHDDTYFYLGVENDTAVELSWGYGVYIDVDGDITSGFTGFGSELPIGADYLLEGGYLLEYIGAGNDWDWRLVSGDVSAQANGSSVEIALPRTLIGDPSTLRLFFNGDNTANGGSFLDRYPDDVLNVSAANQDRYFVYSVFNGDGNAPPRAIAQTISLAQALVVEITLAGSDANEDALSFEVADEPLHGALTGTPPQLTYTPDPTYVGADSFGFSVNDGSATSSVALVSLNISGGPISNQGSIAVDGDLSDWVGAASFGRDPLDANALNDSIDWEEGWVGHDNENVYFAYLNESPINLGWGYAIYIDTDQDTGSGFIGFGGSYPIGADYLVEGNDLQKYTGDGSNWSWVSVGSLDAVVEGAQAELSVARSLLGNPNTLDLFYLGINSSVSGLTNDYYPDTVLMSSALSRNFSYEINQSGVNNPPNASGQVISTDTNAAVAIVLSASDPEGAQLSYEITRQPNHGVLTGIAPSLTYTPPNGFSGTDSFVYRVNDGATNSPPATISINVQQSVPAGGYSNPVTAITLDGDLNDWASVTPFPTDAADIVAGAEEIDWRQGWMAHNDTALYIAYQNDSPISLLTWGHAIYLDTDQSTASGFRGYSSELASGADYLLEGRDLYRYAGSGTNWMWTYVGTVQAENVGEVVEIAIPRSFLGGSTAIDVYWRADNGAIGGSDTDWYPDAASNSAASSADRRFQYNFQP